MLIKILAIIFSSFIFINTASAKITDFSKSQSSSTLSNKKSKITNFKSTKPASSLIIKNRKQIPIPDLPEPIIVEPEPEVLPPLFTCSAREKSPFYRYTQFMIQKMNAVTHRNRTMDSLGFKHSPRNQNFREALAEANRVLNDRIIQIGDNQNRETNAAAIVWYDDQHTDLESSYNAYKDSLNPDTYTLSTITAFRQNALSSFVDCSTAIAAFKVKTLNYVIPYYDWTIYEY